MHPRNPGCFSTFLEKDGSLSEPDPASTLSATFPTCSVPLFLAPVYLRNYWLSQTSCVTLWGICWFRSLKSLLHCFPTPLLLHASSPIFLLCPVLSWIPFPNPGFLTWLNTSLPFLWFPFSRISDKFSLVLIPNLTIIPCQTHSPYSSSLFNLDRKSVV